MQQTVAGVTGGDAPEAQLALQKRVENRIDKLGVAESDVRPTEMLRMDDDSLRAKAAAIDEELGGL